MNANSKSANDRCISLPGDIQSGLDTVFTTVKNRLLCDPPIEILFPAGVTSQTWPAEEIESKNTPTFDSLDENANLYAIFSGSGNANWTPKYVGTRACGHLLERLKQHLVVSTGQKSKLREIKSEVFKGRKIAISYVRIEPDNLREYMEKRIISEERGRLPGRLGWNERI